MSITFDELADALVVLKTCALMVKAKLWSFEGRMIALDREDYYDVQIQAIESCFTFFDVDYTEESDEYHYYFSDQCFMKYYRLCREYGRRRQIKLKDNLYVSRAEEFVSIHLSGPYTCWHNLQTKTRKWGSGLHFYYTSDFCYEHQLVERLLEIRQFYMDGIAELKVELSKPKTLAVNHPRPIETKEAA